MRHPKNNFLFSWYIFLWAIFAAPLRGDGNTLLLLHGDGTHGSTSILDSSPAGRVMTVRGSAYISNTQSKLGSGSLRLNGTSPDAINFTSAIVLNGPFTFECWFRVENPNNIQHFYNSTWSSGGSNSQFRIENSNQFLFYINGPILYATVSTIAANTWHHVALVRDANNVVKVYFNGVASANTITTENPVRIDNIGSWFQDGPSSSYVFHGYLDEVRISNIVRYSANFTPYAGSNTTAPTILTQPQSLVALPGRMTVAAGERHSLVLKQDGSVWSWGDNQNGQLGNGGYSQQRSPVQVGGISGAVAVAAGQFHSLAARNDGTVWAWGANDYGQLGIGTATGGQGSPMQVNISGVRSVAAGHYHSFALKHDGTVFSWGYNGRGQLGDDTYSNRMNPIQISGLTGVSTIASGYEHTLALKSDGTVWSWGTNSYAQLGGIYHNRFVPGQVPGLSGIVAIAAGKYHSLALKADGTVWAWGCNQNGRLGDGSFEDRVTPVQASGLSAMVGLAGGDTFSMAIKKDGSVWTWGGNNTGQLGYGWSYSYPAGIPAPVNALTGVRAVAAGQYHSLATLTDGTMRAWGWYHYGQLGTWNASDNQPEPILVNINGVAASQVVFSVTTDGSSSPTYQWQRKAAGEVVFSNLANNAVYSDVTTSNLRIMNLSGPMNGDEFRCVVSNAAGAVASNPAMLSVGFPGPPQIVSQPQSQTVAAGQTVQFSVVATGIPAPTYQWRKNGAYITGANAPTLTIANVQPSDAASYSVIVSNSVDITTSVATTLSISVPPTITVQPQDTGAVLGSSATFSVNATSSQAMSYQWRKDGTSIPGANSPTLSLSNVQNSAAGNYSVVVSNALGTATSASAALAVRVLAPPTTGAVSAGARHTLTLKSNGTVWAWGYNYEGELGNGTRDPRTNIAQVSGLTNVAAIAAGYSHNLALRTDGSVWSWGGNGHGKLGFHTGSPATVPVQVTGGGYIAVAAGYAHSAVLKSDGTVWTWGHNLTGEQTAEERVNAVQVPGLTNVVAIAAGNSHTYALKGDGTVWAWGWNESGQLGDGSTINRATPVQVVSLTNVIAIRAGAEFGLALKNDGTVRAWGKNNFGQLGDGSTAQRNSPVAVSGLTNAIAIGAGANHAGAVCADGATRTWGYNPFGQLADGTISNRLSPTSIDTSGQMIALSGGSFHTVFLHLDGTVTGAGRADEYQLGDGLAPKYLRPTQTTNVRGVIDAGGGYFFGVARKSDGSVWGWGRNTSAQLGDGTTTDRALPVRVSGINGATALAVGGYHSLVVKNDGTVWSWGRNSEGQLGDGTTTQRAAPVQVPGLTGAIAVAAYQYHSLALKSDGTVRAWGMNNNGQLGDGTNYQRNSPVTVAGLNGVSAVATGFSHSVALKANGTVWAWGENSYGQLGDGTNAYRNVPVQTATLSGVITIAAGALHGMALKSDGTVWTWGGNTAGQLGDGTTSAWGAYRTSPTQVAGLTGIVAIGAGGEYSCAINAAGAVWMWGRNNKGQLGDGTTIDRLSPTAVPLLTGVERVWLRGDQTIAKLQDGSVRTWGESPLAVAFPALRRAAIRLIGNGADSDQDAMNDAWEIQHFGNLARTGHADADGDGLPEIGEFALGSNATVPDEDGDLLTDFADAFPSDPYNGVTPSLAVLRGNNQTTRAGFFNPLPFDVAVYNASGTELIVGAPVSFSVVEGNGLLVSGSSASATLAPSLSLISDYAGTVQAYYQQPTSPYVLSQIRATAGPTQATLTSHSTAEGDSDGNMLQDAWEVAHFTVRPVDPTADADGDGLSNLDEYRYGTDPNDTDTDNDGVSDRNETLVARDPLAPGDGSTLDSQYKVIIRLPNSEYRAVTNDWAIVPAPAPPSPP